MAYRTVVDGGLAIVAGSDEWKRLYDLLEPAIQKDLIDLDLLTAMNFRGNIYNGLNELGAWNA